MQKFEAYAHYYNLIYKHKPYKKEAEMVYKWLGEPTQILDVGCGTGQHAKHWCKKCFVLGVEKSSSMLSHAYKHNNITYVNTLPLYSRFDSITAMFNVVGYFWLDSLLKQLPISKGGHFIFDCWDTDKIKAVPPKVQLKRFKTFSRLMIPEIIFYPFIGFHIIIIANDKVYDEYHDLQSYSTKRIKELCKIYGYKIVGTKETTGWTKWYKLRKI